jgi:hypothetical protein
MACGSETSVELFFDVRIRQIFPLAIFTQKIGTRFMAIRIGLDS